MCHSLRKYSMQYNCEDAVWYDNYGNIHQIPTLSGELIGRNVNINTLRS